MCKIKFAGKCYIKYILIVAVFKQFLCLMVFGLYAFPYKQKRVHLCDKNKSGSDEKISRLYREYQDSFMCEISEVSL